MSRNRVGRREIERTREKREQVPGPRAPASSFLPEDRSRGRSQGGLDILHAVVVVHGYYNELRGCNCGRDGTAFSVCLACRRATCDLRCAAGNTPHRVALRCAALRWAGPSRASRRLATWRKLSPCKSWPRATITASVRFLAPIMATTFTRREKSSQRLIAAATARKRFTFSRMSSSDRVHSHGKSS